MKPLLPTFVWFLGWGLVCLGPSSCSVVTRTALDQLAHFTLTSLHAENVSLSYTIRDNPNRNKIHP